jgi:DNA-binding MurR/RpiR family transcriptional regulator
MKQRVSKVNSAEVGVSTATLVPLCWQNGYHGVPKLAAKLKRHPKTIWCAVRWPERYGPTYKLIKSALIEDKETV